MQLRLSIVDDSELIATDLRSFAVKGSHERTKPMLYYSYMIFSLKKPV